MSAPTRRQLMAAGLAATATAGAPAIAIAADPEERLRNATRELRAALRGVWPGCDLRDCDWLLKNSGSASVVPEFMICAYWRQKP